MIRCKNIERFSMGLAHKVTNKETGDQYVISTVNRHINNYYVEEIGIKVNITCESRISLLRPGKHTSKRKDVVGYVDYCRKLNFPLEEFHIAVGYYTKYAEGSIIDYIVDKLNEIEDSSTFDKENGGFIYPKEIHIYTLAGNILPPNFNETAADIFENL